MEGFILSDAKLNKVINRLLVDAEENLIITKADDYVKVGPYTITEEDEYFVFSKKDVNIDVFNNKKAAIAYAVSRFYRTDKVDMIKKYDEKIGKYLEDIRFYRRSLVIAQKKNDSVKEDIMMCRLDFAYHGLNKTKTSLLQEIKKIQFA